ncbi:DUF11 domain-containing protein, partial [Chryseobacterium sp. EO14]|uniref:DUF11 domain-containing protein n=1 Tax=Chryseobacterium sp. EO14 TaxID=2950551 RepID=UPI00210E53A4
MKKIHITTESIENKKIIRVFFYLFIFFISSNTYGQSFAYDISGQNFSFVESNRTLISGTENAVNSVYRYDNLITVNNRTIYGKLTIANITDASINTFDNDAIGINTNFQPVISTTSVTGNGFINYTLEFFDAITNIPVYLYNFNLTGYDLDGISVNEREFYNLYDFTSYKVNTSNGLLITNTALNTLFRGLSTNTTGIGFADISAFIASYNSPKTLVAFSLGSTGTNLSRQFSMKLGTEGGVFTNPTIVSNPNAVNLGTRQTNLSVAKTVNNSAPIIGQNVIFTLTAKNNGPGFADNVIVSDKLNNGFTFVSATLSPAIGSYDSATGFWNLVNLSNGETRTLTIVARVTSTGSYQSSAGITGNQIDPDVANNVSTITIIPGFPDSDNDGVTDDLDLDDDNDGILDSAEINCQIVTNPSFTGNANGWTLTGSVVHNTNNSLFFNTLGTVPNGKVEQTVNTKANSIYRITFNLSSSLATDTGLRLDVIDNATNQIIGTNTFLKTVSNVPSVESMTFVASSSGTRLLFSDVTTAAAAAVSDLQLDTVSILYCDTDNDGIPDNLDLDSDGDGCPDAIEGSANFVSSNLFSTSMLGGNSGTGYNGTSTLPIQTNLCNSSACISADDTTRGVPIIAGLGQSVNFSRNVILNECTDTDNDGITDLNDLDDDNDGILDAN